MSLRVSDDEYENLLRRTGVTPPLAEPAKPIKPGKYRAKRVSLGDEHFDSQAEARRWLQLKMLADTGQITDLARQVPYEVVVAGIKICKYLADFAYVEDGAGVVEDVKGMKTPVYRLKKKLVEAIYGIKIREVTMK